MNQSANFRALLLLNLKIQVIYVVFYYAFDPQDKNSNAY